MGTGADSSTVSCGDPRSMQVHADALSRSCGEFFHSSVDDRNDNGENMFMCWGSEPCFTPQVAMKLLCEFFLQAPGAAQYLSML